MDVGPSVRKARSYDPHSHPDEPALMVISVDNPIPDWAISEIQQAGNIFGIKGVTI
jgi:D-3-phosphoglycerate dehydrogenase